MGIPPGFRGDWRFFKIRSKGGGLGPIAILGGNGLFRGEDKFFQGGLRTYHINLEKFFNLSSILAVSNTFVGAFSFVFLDDVALRARLHDTRSELKPL